MKRALLFVDDEPNVIRGLKRMLRVMRDKWDVHFAASGAEALQVLTKVHIDVVVSDMRMPEMDGASLLEEVMRCYPHITRIILSGYSDQKMILRSTKVAHRFLVKPCDLETLKNMVERACFLNNLLVNEKLVELVRGIDFLPSLPTLYHKLINEMYNPDTSLKRVGDIIAQDVAMSAKILQVVNSAFFGLPQKVTRPHLAVSLLGLDVIKGLVLYVQVFATLENETTTEGLSLEDLWQHSLQVSALAEEIVLSEVDNDKILRGDALIVGLLHDIGKLLLLKIPGHHAKIEKYMQEKKCSYCEAEYELTGSSHAEVGAYLLGLWGIPDHIVEAVALHHFPSRLPDNTFTALTAVHLANALLHEADYTKTTEDIPGLDIKYLHRVNLKSELADWMELCEKIKKKKSD